MLSKNGQRRYRLQFRRRCRISIEKIILARLYEPNVKFSIRSQSDDRRLRGTRARRQISDQNERWPDFDHVPKRRRYAAAINLRNSIENREERATRKIRRSVRAVRFTDETDHVEKERIVGDYDIGYVGQRFDRMFRTFEFIGADNVGGRRLVNFVIFFVFTILT